MSAIAAQFIGCWVDTSVGGGHIRCERCHRAIAVAILALGIVFAAMPRSVAAAAPNIVFIVTDDLDARSLNTMVAHGLMPNLKRYIIEPGTTFSNSFVVTSLCCPSRATLLTGQYPHNHGVLRNDPPNGGVTALDDASTLATWLHGAGYRTGLVGKYLNGYGANRDLSTRVDDATYIPPGWDDWQVLARGDTLVYNYTINDNGTVLKQGSTPADYQADVLARRAEEFIDESNALNDAQPFFLLLTPTTPHAEPTWATKIPNCTHGKWSPTIRPAPRHQEPLPAAITLPQRPDFNEADMRDKPPLFQLLPPLTSEDIRCVGQQYRDRLKSLKAVDDLVGRVGNALRRDGELGNTVLIFTSDNGWFYGEHRLNGKTWAYEESIRVPLFIRAPRLPGPQTTQRLVLNTDWAPTIADFAGVTPGRPVDGRSLIPLLKDPLHAPWRKRFLVEVRDNPEPSPAVLLAIRSTGMDVATPSRLYVEWGDGSKELYVLSDDPYELNSQHADPARAREMGVLSRWISELKSCGHGSCQRLEDQ